MLKLFKNKEISKILTYSFTKCQLNPKFFHSFRLSSIESPQNECLRILQRDKRSKLELARPLYISSVAFSDAEPSEETDDKDKKDVDPSKLRTRVIDPETSIRYLKSKAYETTYGDEPVWVKYRRNFKGQFVPRKSRQTCIRGGVITTGNPCPICRDEYLVLHYTNVDLLKQFIHPETGEILDTRKTHICQKRLLQLEVAIEKAKFYGLLKYQVPFRKYDYSEYYPDLKEM
ncbi:28S ribosomal protein S18b like protein [Argiope bruennichi]|uniref:Small ribosomal subunit protein mS40 n=1 Tax=Argiope bruennichi TaxID=94029 RepID=A0A8T0ER25_ARGBR|nr:28S ribosomal protein S18b like protein [Argiope bruennichi]